MRAWIPGALASLLTLAAQAEPTDACHDRRLRLNDLVAIGTHNSYKLEIPAPEMALLKERAPQTAITLDYAHPPLDEQLNDGARQLELDVYVDAQGGRFAAPLAAKFVGATLPAEWVAEMARPGFKVMHVPDVDFRSSCPRFVACLAVIRDWSKTHASHAPLLILINAKDSGATMAGATPVAPFAEAAFDALDAEIRSVFGEDELITPDEVQGAHPTLREAATHGGWPTLEQARGKVLFALDDAPDKVQRYRGARKSLEGRAMFVNIDESSPAAAYITLNDPLVEQERIRSAVKQGLLVRTRADADTHEARRNDSKRLQAALSSGAQYISTDYRRPDRRWSDYAARLAENAAARVNALRAPACADRIVDE